MYGGVGVHFLGDKAKMPEKKTDEPRLRSTNEQQYLLPLDSSEQTVLQLQQI